MPPAPQLLPAPHEGAPVLCRVFVTTPSSRREPNSTTLPWACFLCSDPSSPHSLMVRENASLPSSFPGPRILTRFSLKKKSID